MSIRPRGALRTLASRLRELLPHPARASDAPRLRGRMRRAIVVPAPGEMFSEAVFVLRDDMLREPGLDQDALLREAARAAEGYTAEVLPGHRGPRLHPLAAFLLGAASALLLVWALGLL